MVHLLIPVYSFGGGKDVIALLLMSLCNIFNMFCTCSAFLSHREQVKMCDLLVLSKTNSFHFKILTASTYQGQFKVCHSNAEWSAPSITIGIRQPE